MSLFKVRIEAGDGYEVTVGGGLLAGCGAVLKEALGGICRIALITDSVVEGLYLAPVIESLAGAGFRVSSFTYPAGERSKNMSTLEEILEFLAAERFTRTDCIAALGGGVTGDLTGFAAGCYLRGIRYVQLPTTLLAAVDSSVGGKTAVNLEAGKNLAGLFVQPAAVICDPDCLASLPPAVFAGGMAEAIKTGVLAGEALFSLLERDGAGERLPDIIARCVAYKGRVVEADEREAGPRRILNLGHTVGHAMEKCSGFTLSHGHAVAAGMAVIARAAVRLGYCRPACAARIESTLLKHDLPVTAPFTAAELAEAALGDKKRAGGRITLVIPRAVGDCTLREIPLPELQGVITAGLEE